MPDDARRALLTGLFDHAPTFPPARLPPADALAEARRARASEHAWLLGRLVWPASLVGELDPSDEREAAFVEPGIERQGEVEYLEGVPLDEIAALGVRAKLRCGGERIPPVDEVSAFVRGCRERGLVFKATGGLHHAYPTPAGEHGFLNLLAAAVFGDEEEALAAAAGSFELDAEAFRWDGRSAPPGRLADVRAALFQSIGSCSFFEPVEELERLGMLP
ncbi:MAG TPA: hypothetical protein VLW49_09995 [Gaiellaceae bacterium]|nr:hypothetical protein [Gaiellaceae bacterium]